MRLAAVAGLESMGTEEAWSALQKGATRADEEGPGGLLRRALRLPPPAGATENVEERRMDEKDSVNASGARERPAPRDAESKAFQKTGVDLLIRFHIVDKIAKIYDTKNDAFQEQGRLLFEAVAAVLKDEEEATFRVRHGALLLNGVASQVRRRDLRHLQVRHGGVPDAGSVEAVTFLPGLTLDELFRFMSVFAKREKKDDDRLRPARRRSSTQPASSHVDLEKISAEEIAPSLHEEHGPDVLPQHRPSQGVVRARTSRNEPIKINTTRRLMQSIYNHIVDNEALRLRPDQHQEPRRIHPQPFGQRLPAGHRPRPPARPDPGRARRPGHGRLLPRPGQDSRRRSRS